MANSDWPALDKSLRSLLDIYRHKELDIIKTIQKFEDEISTLKNEILIQEQSQQNVYSVINQCILDIDQAISVGEINKNKLNIRYFKDKINIIEKEKALIQEKIAKKLDELDLINQQKIKICKKIYKYELIYESQEAAAKKERY